MTSPKSHQSMFEGSGEQGALGGLGRQLSLCMVHHSIEIYMKMNTVVYELKYTGRQVAIAKKVLSASIEGKRIDPVPEMSNLEAWRNKAESLSPPSN